MKNSFDSQYWHRSIVGIDIIRSINQYWFRFTKTILACLFSCRSGKLCRLCSPATSSTNRILSKTRSWIWRISHFAFVLCPRTHPRKVSPSIHLACLVMFEPFTVKIRWGERSGNSWSQTSIQSYFNERIDRLSLFLFDDVGVMFIFSCGVICIFLQPARVLWGTSLTSLPEYIASTEFSPQVQHHKCCRGGHPMGEWTIHPSRSSW